MAVEVTNQVYYLIPNKSRKGCYYLKPLNLVYYLTKDAPFDKNFTLNTANHMLPSYGKPITVNLPEGDYKITPLGGACDDWADHDYWTWHVRTTEGDLGGKYSLEAPTFGDWADTAEKALGSVKNEKLEFHWDGGSFKMWLPTCDKQVPTNNSGSIKINVKKIKKDKL